MIRKTVILISQVYGAALAVLWVGSYLHTPPLLLRLDDRQLYTTASNGHLVIGESAPTSSRLLPNLSRCSDKVISDLLAHDVRHRRTFLQGPAGHPVWYYHLDVMHPFSEGYTVISLWLFAVPPGMVFLVLAILALRRSVRGHRRRMRSQCAHCGYDLTAEALTVCPGCGDPATSRRGRVQRVAKWTGLYLCLVILTVAVASPFVHAAYIRPTDDGQWVIELEGSAIVFETSKSSRFSPPVSFSRFCRVPPVGRKIEWRPQVRIGNTRAPSGTHDGFSIVMPLWIFLVFAAVSTAWLWWRDRRPSEGHCQTCGYDLTGNVSGVCPECGSPT